MSLTVTADIDSSFSLYDTIVEMPAVDGSPVPPFRRANSSESGGQLQDQKPHYGHCLRFRVVSAEMYGVRRALRLVGDTGLEPATSSL